MPKVTLRVTAPFSSNEEKNPHSDREVARGGAERAEVLLHLRLGKEDKKMALLAGLQVATAMRAGHYQCNYSISTF